MKKILLKKRTKKIDIIFICVILVLSFGACGTKETALMESEDLVFKEQEIILESADIGKELAVESGDSSEEAAVLHNEKQMEQSNLFVHICGAVNIPGVYELPYGSRVFDAIEAAGGLCEDASDSSVNMALLLEDGWKIVIPTIDEINLGENANLADTGGIYKDTNSKEKSNTKLVNINTATKEELCSLPGIGDSRAESIVAYREKNNGFASIEDIMKVEGIKDGMFSKMKDKICVN